MGDSLEANCCLPPSSLCPNDWAIIRLMESLDEQIMHHLDSLQARNSPETCLTAFDLVLKLLANIVANPQDPRFRAVKKTNKAIQAKLLTCVGVLEFFTTLGFTPMDDSLIFLGDDMGNLELTHALVEGRIEELRETVGKRHEEQKRPEEQKKQPPKQDLSKMSDEKRRLMEQFENDRREANARLVPTQASRANHLNFGAKQTCFKDIGVDINKKGG